MTSAHENNETTHQKKSVGTVIQSHNCHESPKPTNHCSEKATHIDQIQIAGF